MRPAHSCIHLALMLSTTVAMTFAPAASAQNNHLSSDVLNTQAPTLPLTHQPLQPSGDLGRQPGNWSAANQTVAEFPNGHADVLQWEAQQQQPATKPAQKPIPMTMPMHQQHHQHGGKP
ncbi:hypothetical protein G7047_06665 [Diaphorobacter sp. HDW4A]|uniref:hypothetical protein n=1 Tax=Diaphorobacter sp. HDW4A TaxID=2714924 RepID=UPI00140C55DC|nr:hypothetical protein [Diaphorobacter sp. HDW4A]QIL79616.1 hypothetical protein G7047_06665 [Diaphorobacter sp. HDW4A]